MPRPQKRHLFLKTFIVLCFLGAIVGAITLRGMENRDSVKREVMLVIDTCKYDARTKLIDYTYTVRNPGTHETGAIFDVRFIDQSTAPVGTDIVIVPRVTPGTVIKGLETVRVGTKVKTITCESTLRAIEAQ